MRSAHELIPTANSVDAQVQDTANELLLHILQALAERPCSSQATRNSCLFQSVGSSKTVRRSYQQQYCSTPSIQQLLPPLPAKLILRSMVCMHTRQKKPEAHVFKLTQSRVGAIKDNNNKT